MIKLVLRVISVAMIWCGTVAARRSTTTPLNSPPQQDDRPVTVELIAEDASVQPGGQTRVGILFHIADGWHIYAQTPGDAGLPTKVIWTSLLPNGAYLETPPQWPPAQHFTDPGDIHTFGYSGMLLLAATLRASPQVSAAEIPLTAHAQWLACREICVPGNAALSRPVPVSIAPPTRSPQASLFPPAN